MSENQLFETPPTYRTEWGGVVELPYAGTSGWSGTNTSKERAEDADSSGLTGKRQRLTLDLLNDAGTAGLTCPELENQTGWHHGLASGVLSVLHKTGHVARLTTQRNRCKVYVLPQHTVGRATETQGRAKTRDEIEELLHELLRHNLPIESRALIMAFFDE
jgi:hypothetical protein